MKYSVFALIVTLAMSLPCAADVGPMDSGFEATHLLPYIPHGSSSSNQGFFSFRNPDSTDTQVHLRLYDEMGTAGPRATVVVSAGTTRWANIDDLLRGNAAKGIHTVPGGLLGDTALWAFVEPESPTTVTFAYLRSPAGFVVPVGRVATTAVDGRSWWQIWSAVVPFVNPADNLAVRSVLRLVNPAAEPRSVGLAALDAQGIPSAAVIDCVIPAYATVSLSSIELETGPRHRACVGSGWGDGTGKWLAYVWDRNPGRDDPLVLISLLYSVSTGLITNVSAPGLPEAPAPDRAPASAAAFVELVGDDVLSLQPAIGRHVGKSSSEYSFTLAGAHTEGGRFTRVDLTGDTVVGQWEYRKEARSRIFDVVPGRFEVGSGERTISARQRAFLILDHEGQGNDGGLCDTELEFTDVRRGTVSMLCREGVIEGGVGVFELAQPTL